MDFKDIFIFIVLPVLTLGAPLFQKFMERRKFKVEAAAIERESMAKTDSQVSDTAIRMIDRLESRLQRLESDYANLNDCYAAEKQKHQAETERLLKEIDLLRVNINTAKVERTAAISLARKYFAAAVDLELQLKALNIQPRHCMDTSELDELEG
jgi:hypothetical protein